MARAQPLHSFHRAAPRVGWEKCHTFATAAAAIKKRAGSQLSLTDDNISRRTCAQNGSFSPPLGRYRMSGE